VELVMSATVTMLSPEDNRELLDAAAAAFEASREDSKRGVTQAKRDMAIALVATDVLIAVRDRRPACEPGPTGSVMIAFSDDEAAAAWVRGRHPAAPASELASTAELSPGGPGRKHWLTLLEGTGASSVALNPAGPLGSVVYDEELRATRPRLMRRSARADHPWLDVAARQAERARVAPLLEALNDAIARRDEQAFAELRPQLPALNQIGSLLWAAELQLLSGRRHLAKGSAKDGLYQMIYGSFGFGRFGDPYRSIDGLLEAGGVLLDRRDGGDWQTAYLTELCEVLEQIRTGYRDQEVAKLLAMASEWR
jgi:hypothetical protein